MWLSAIGDDEERLLHCDLLRQFASVRSLRLIGSRQNSEGDIIQRLAKTCCRLTNLRLRLVSFDQSTVLQRFLTNNASTLETLHLSLSRLMPGTDDVKLRLSALRKFACYRSPEGVTQPCDIFRMMPNLERLQIYSGSFGEGLMDVPQICPLVTHLSIVMDGWNVTGIGQGRGIIQFIHGFKHLTAPMYFRWERIAMDFVLTVQG